MKQSAAVPVTATTAKPIKADSDFISQMVRNCDQRVYRLALRITRNNHDAEDVRQETMLKVFRHVDQFEGRACFTTWISRIAINEALMNLRKRNDWRRVPLEDVAEKSEDIFALRQFRPPAENPESNFRRRELRASIDEAVHSLRPLYRDVFILRAVEERSTSETARVLSLTANTVKTRLRRARAALRESLAMPGSQPENPLPVVTLRGLEANLPDQKGSRKAEIAVERRPVDRADRRPQPYHRRPSR